MSASTSVLGSGSSRSGDRPLSGGARRAPAARGREGGARAAREQRDVLDQVEEGLLGPLDVVEDADEGRLLLEQLAERPRDLVGRRWPLRLTEQRAKRRRGRGIGRKDVELLQHFDHRPVGDPLAVGEAAAADDPSRRRRRGTRRPAATCRRPASPTIVTSSQRSSARARSQACRAASSSRSLPTNRASCAPLGRLADGREPVGRDRAPPCPSARAARPPRSRPRRGRARSVSSPIRISPGCAACSRRAATLTASPVARRSSCPSRPRRC